MKNKLFYLLLIPFLSFSQINIIGKVVSEDKKPIELTEVILYTNDSILVGKKLTDKDGNFLIECQKGFFNIEIRHLGFVSFKESIKLNETIDLGTITMRNEQLAEPINEQNFIESNANGFVMNLENNIVTPEIDAFTLLKKFHIVITNGDKINLSGKNNVLVSIDGKKMDIENVANILRTIPSSKISKIEVIMNPSNKFETQEDTGIINILLKKNLEEGFNVAINSSYKQNKFPSFNNSINAVYNHRKWSINSSIGYGRDKNFWENDVSTFYPTTSFIGTRGSDFKFNCLKTFIDVQYQVSEKTRINISSINDKNENTIEANDKINIYNNLNLLERNYLGNRMFDLNSNRNSLNFLLRHDFNKKNKFLTFEADWIQRKGYYSQHTYGQDYDILGAAILNRSYVTFHNVNFDIDVYSLNGMFNVPTKWFDLTIGGKWIYVELDYDVRYYRKYNAEYEQDLSLSPICKYIENRQSILTDLKKRIGKWEFQIGFKLENTLLNGYLSTTDHKEIDDKYCKFFPLVSTKYNFNEENRIVFTYAKNFNRPLFRFINPSLGIYNAYENYKGNPFVNPAISDNVSFIYYFKSKYDLGISYSKTKNSIESLTNFTTDNVVAHNVLNYMDLNTFQVTGNTNFKCLDFIETNLQLQGFYKYNQSLVTVINDISIWGWYGMVSNQFQLNKSKTISSNLNFWYGSRTIEQENFVQSHCSLDFGTNFLLLNRDLIIGLNITDILKSSSERMESTVDNINQKFRNYWEPRSFKISATYKFGNRKLNYKERIAENIIDHRR